MYPTQARQSVTHCLERAPVDEQHLVTPVIDGDTDCPFPERWIDIVEPRLSGLENMTVRIHGEE
jgi:hypothetical protein